MADLSVQVVFSFDVDDLEEDAIDFVARLVDQSPLDSLHELMEWDSLWESSISSIQRG